MSVTVIPDTGVNNIVVFPNGEPSLNLNAPSNSDKVEIEVKESLNIHNYLEGIQGGESGKFFHLSESQYLNLVTGDVIRPSDTGQFYPISNPEGFITGVNLDGYVPISRELTINGSTYNLSENRSWTIESGGGSWGSIEGTVTDQTDLTTYLSTNYIPYTGAINNLDLGEYSLNADSIVVKKGANSVAILNGKHHANGSAIILGNSLAGTVNTAMDFNNAIFLGNDVGYNVTNAIRSILIGEKAGYDSQNIQDAVLLGANAGSNTSNISYSIFLGRYAGYFSTNANNSIFLGDNAGFQATSASYSIFLGRYAGYFSTNANNSVFLGRYAGYYAINASYSVFLGRYAGSQATNASYSVFLGDSAGYQASSAATSIFLGYNAGYYAINAAGSIFLGNNAGNFSINASYSIFLGRYAGYQAFDASYSIFLGDNAGSQATSDGNAIAIGTSASPLSYNNTVAIGVNARNTASYQSNISNALFIDDIDTSSQIPLSSTYGKIGGAWEVNEAYYISALTQDSYSIYDGRTGTHLTIPNNTTCIIDFDIIIKTASGLIDAFKISGLCQNIEGSLMPIGKLRAMSDTGITSYEWFEEGLNGELIPSLGTWYESATSTLKFDIVGNTIQITSTESNTDLCGSVKITKTRASLGGGYY